MRRIFSVVLLLTVFASLWGNHSLAQPPEAKARQEPANLLQNPGFEGSYYPWMGINEVQVAHGWTPWWRNRTDADPPAYFFKPEYKRADGYVFPKRVHGGTTAQQWFTFHATHQAGMYQQVFNVTPGVRYRFTIWAHVWSSTQDNPDISVDPAYPHLRVGIDPTGNWDPWAGTVIWSGSYHPIDQWMQLAIEAVAQNNIITVFMYSNPNWPVKHNDTYWDDAVLVAVGDAGQPAPPTATLVAPPPAATPTPGAPPPPTPTCAPAPADWVTYSVQRGDTLFSLAKSRGTTVERVVSVNCLSSTTIHVGQALLLPPLSATVTPAAATAAATLTPTHTPTRTPTATATPTRAATPTAPATPSPTPEPTAVSATATAVPVAQATVTPPPPTLAPPATSTSGAPPPPPTSAPAGSSGRPCGTIAVGAGIVLVAGALNYRRKK
jgi:LysM repeat protein